MALAARTLQRGAATSLRLSFKVCKRDGSDFESQRSRYGARRAAFKQALVARSRMRVQAAEIDAGFTPSFCTDFWDSHLLGRYAASGLNKRSTRLAVCRSWLQRPMRLLNDRLYGPLGMATRLHHCGVVLAVGAVSKTHAASGGGEVDMGTFLGVFAGAG